tara:strand:+ start:2631 stop:3035 length:405 start_codon:yes stop_codon:yes gene_type:complete
LLTIILFFNYLNIYKKMVTPISPRSRTLAALSIAKGTYMDTISVRKWHTTLTVFFVSWFVLFSIFTTFYPTALMQNSDFLDAVGVAASKDNSDRKNGDDNVLSDNGRALVWGSSLGFAALIAFVYHFVYVRLFI